MQCPTGPTSSTFRCLAISEILEEIGLDLYRSPEGKKTLAGLARTCHPFHQFFIPVLWRKLDSLVPLLRLLPNDTWTDRSDTTGQTNFRLVLEELADKAYDRLDWTRFDMYACHVRQFKWDTPTDVSIFALLDIPALRRGRVLLPSLRSLFIQEDRSSYLSSLSFLISPTLASVVLHATDDCCNPDSLLRDIRDNCTMLTTLQISADRMVAFKGSAGNQLAASLQGLSSLHTIYCPTVISAECFAALGRLPHLTELIFNGIAKEDAPMVRHAVHNGLPRGSTWFPALKVLEWRMEEIDEDTAAILQSFQTRQMDQLWLRCKRSPGTSALQKSMKAIACSPYKDSLQNLLLEFMRDSSDTDTEYETSPPEPQETLELVCLRSVLEPLALSSPQLVSLVVDEIHYAITDDVMLWIATTFPLLKSLYLASPDVVSQGAHHELSLRALTTVAKKCSHLVNLELCVDDIDIHIDMPSEQTVNTSAPQSSQSPLEHLALRTKRLSCSNTWQDFGAELAKDLDLIADFVLQLFPKARFEFRFDNMTVESHWNAT